VRASDRRIEEDVKRLRAEIHELAALSDAAVEALYSYWSEEKHFAGWLILLERNDEFAACVRGEK